MEDLDEAQCSACSGTGHISNGYAARAEFIRVQIELARLDWNYERDERNDKRYEKIADLRLRERELLFSGGENKMQTRWEWFPGVKLGPTVELTTLNNTCVYSRGFPSAVTCTAADFLANVEKLFTMPIERVTLSDVRIVNDTLRREWLAGFPRIEQRAFIDPKRIHFHPTEESLRKMLNRELVNYGRRATGLEPLTEDVR